MTKTYPPFAPPLPFATKPPEEWTKREAKEYLAWVIGHIDERTDALLDYLGVQAASDHVGVLSDAGSRAATLLKDPTFSQPSQGPTTITLKGHQFEQDLGPTLTTSGYALAADLGLLVVRYLLTDFPEAIHWEVGKGPRRYVWYNRPTLVVPGRDPFDPVGASIGQAYGILTDDRDGRIWMLMYERCVADMAGDTTQDWAALLRPQRK